MAYFSIKKFKMHPDEVSKDQISTMCRTQKLTETFMRAYAKWLDWDMISLYQDLSEQFIDEMHNYVNFYGICNWNRHPHFSEQFMDKWKEELDWAALSKYCTSLTKDFIYSHMEYIHINELLRNEYVLKNFKSIDLLNDFIRYTYTRAYDWMWPHFNDITIDFVREHVGEITNWRHIVTHFADDMKFHDEFHKYYKENEWRYLSEFTSSYTLDFILKYSSFWVYDKMHIPFFPTKYLSTEDIKELEKFLNIMKNRKNNL